MATGEETLSLLVDILTNRSNTGLSDQLEVAIGQAVPRGTYVQTLPVSNGVDDTVAINLRSVFAVAGTHLRGTPGQTYLLSGPIVTPNGGHVTIDMTGCRVVLLAGNQKNMVTNYAYAHPVAVGTGTVALGSNVVTTALAAQAVVGQTLALTGAGAADGAGGTSYGPLIGNISAVNTGAGTVTLTKLQGTPANATAAVTTTGAAVGNLPAIGVATLYNRDKNITIKGGRWDRGANGPNGTLTGYGANMIAHSILLEHVDGLTIDIERADSTAGVSFVWATDVSNYSLSVRDGNVIRTAIQINGPAYNGSIPYCSSVHTDDLVSVGTNAYLNDTDTAGDVIGLTWGVIESQGVRGTVAGAAIRLLAGVGNRVDGVVGGQLRGTAYYDALIGDATGGGHPETGGGTYGDIDFGYLSGSPNVLMSITAPSCDRIRARGVASAAVTPIIQTTAPANVGTLELSFDFTPAAANDVLVDLRGGTIGHVILNSCNVSANGSNTPVFLDLTGATVDTLTLRDCMMVLSAAQGGSFGYAVWNLIASSLKRLRVVGGSYSNGAAIYRAITGTPAIDIKMLGVSTTNMGRLLNLSSASAAIHLDQVDCTNNTSAAIVTTGCPLTIDGSGISMTTGNVTLVQRVNGTEVVTVKSLQIPIDVSLAALTANSLAYNANAALACGAGPVIANGTTWKHLYSGLTYP